MLTEDSYKCTLDIFLKTANDAFSEYGEYIAIAFANEVEERMKKLENQKEYISYITGLWKGDFTLIAVIAQKLGCFDNKNIIGLFNILKKNKSLIFQNGIKGLPSISKGLRSVYSLASVENLSEIQLFAEKGARYAAEALKEESKKLIASTTDSLAKNFMTSLSGTPVDTMFRDLFKLIDKDQSGYLCYIEFWDLWKYMGLYLNQEESLEMFALSDSDNSGYIDYFEFQKAVILIKVKIAYETLKKLGITTEDLIWFGIATLIYLFLMLVFIFLGIFAFSKAEGFNSVVNSILPLAAGVLAALRGVDMKEKIDAAKEYIQKMITEFQRAING
jgi:hypothetical protein